MAVPGHDQRDWEFAKKYNLEIIEVVSGGNINEARIRLGKYDANYGMLLRGDGDASFTYIPQHESGLSLRGDVRSVLEVNNTFLFGVNRSVIRAYKLVGE